MAPPARGTKRKAADSDPSVPAAKMAKGPVAATTPTIAAPATPETPVSERTSRSGRVIKAKKFVDEVAGMPQVTEEKPLSITFRLTLLPFPHQDEAKSVASTPAGIAKKNEGKLYVQVKATGDVVEIDPHEDKPEK